MINPTQQLFGQFVANDQAQLDEMERKKNTPLAYKPKQAEFRAYCDFFYQRQPPELRYTVTKDKVEAFMTYCLFREQKPRGGKRKRCIVLDHEKANQIIETFSLAERDETGKVTEETKSRYAALEPVNGLGFSYLNTTKAALRAMFLRQKRLGVNSNDKAQVFGEHVKWCLKQAKLRKHIQGKKNYVKKMDSTSAPLAAVKYVKGIEEYLFNKGIKNQNNPRVLFRH